MPSRNIILLIGLSLIVMASCSSKNKDNSSNESTQNIANTKPAIEFNEDSAYNYVKAQVDFGPRVPNTEAHRRTADYLANTLRSFGVNVTVQEATLKAFDGTQLKAKNIIAEFNPQLEKRILLLAHWDSRPFADNDPDKAKQKLPVMGANDGASGVGVLLEIARIISTNTPNVGIDILLADAEDWGDSSGSIDSENTWALGTQYWTENLHRPNYSPQYGILLDMVGAENAKFYKEMYSMKYAQQVVNMVWSIGQESGYSEFFINKVGGGITDDHIFVNKIGIPCINIIDQNGGTSTGFFPAWHTTYDTMNNISPATLKAVGQTVVNLIYKY